MIIYPTKDSESYRTLSNKERLDVWESKRPFYLLGKTAEKFKAALKEALK